MNFDRVAQHYQRLETIAFGNALQRARVTWLRKVENPRRVLIVGEGNGRFLCALLRKYPEAEVDCVDSSARMLQLAYQRLLREVPEAEPRVRFFCDDVRDWSPNEKTYDLIVTHFVLDCFREKTVAAIVAKLARAATDQSAWLLADFSISQGFLARLHAQVWVWAMYLFFRATAGVRTRRLVSPTPFLKANGFYRAHRRHWRGGLIKSEVWCRNA